ncbi:MAG: hypothetical protein ABIG94_03645 [Pseudomonadota bacterium]
MKTRLLTTVMVVVLLLGLMAIAAHAETLQARQGDKVLLFKSQDQMDFAIKHLASGGSFMDPAYLSTIAGLVDSGTRCSVIKSTWTTKRVRIMEGPFKGVTGWTPSEMVSP